MSIVLNNPEVAAKYDAVFSKDRVITLQGLYWGKLSNITPEAAARLITNGDNQLKLKTATASEKKAEHKKPDPEK